MSIRKPIIPIIFCLGFVMCLAITLHVIRSRFATFHGHTGLVHLVVSSLDGRILASVSQDKTVKLWDVNVNRQLPTLRGHAGDIWSIAFSPDGTLLASAGDDTIIKLWDVSTG